ncbi:MAG: SMP-30/gluconolactonase/LRE family protein [Streptosporangiales bacterium]
MRAEQVTAPIAHHGEGPAWDAATGRLLSVDMLAGDLLALDLDTGDVTRTHVHDVLACVRPRARGGYVCGIERGFALLDAGSDVPQVLPEVWSDEGVRMNDGGCDPQGRFYCGSMAYDNGAGRGALWRMDPGGSTESVLTNVTVANGLAWSLDGATVYHIDSPTREISAYAFDASAGTFHDRRVVASFPDIGDAVPDGMSIDAEGGLWIAFFRGSQVRRYASDGTLTERVDLPVTQVTAVAFGGQNLDRLYITTSKEGMRGDQPAAGAIFQVTPDVRGAPVLPYAS